MGVAAILAQGNEFLSPGSAHFPFKKGWPRAQKVTGKLLQQGPAAVPTAAPNWLPAYLRHPEGSRLDYEKTWGTGKQW